jgi:hypothetical protein
MCPSHSHLRAESSAASSGQRGGGDELKSFDDDLRRIEHRLTIQIFGKTFVSSGGRALELPPARRRHFQ